MGHIGKIAFNRDEWNEVLYLGLSFPPTEKGLSTELKTPADQQYAWERTQHSKSTMKTTWVYLLSPNQMSFYAVLKEMRSLQWGTWWHDFTLRLTEPWVRAILRFGLKNISEEESVWTRVKRRLKEKLTDQDMMAASKPLR